MNRTNFVQILYESTKNSSPIMDCGVLDASHGNGTLLEVRAGNTRFKLPDLASLRFLHGAAVFMSC